MNGLPQRRNILPQLTIISIVVGVVSFISLVAELELGGHGCMVGRPQRRLGPVQADVQHIGVTREETASSEKHQIDPPD